MSEVTSKEIRDFADEISNMAVRMGGGKVGIDAMSIRRLVKHKRRVAKRYVELQCLMADSQPGYLQPAMLVAGAFVVEFQDHSLLEKVAQKAKELNATDILQALGLT